MSSPCWSTHHDSQQMINQQAGSPEVNRIKVQSDFSIDAILSLNKTKSHPVESPAHYPDKDLQTEEMRHAENLQYSWLYCTRYQPPKLPRVKRDTVCNAKYRNPRIPFSIMEVAVLEEKFRQAHYLGSKDVAQLATALNMTPKRVKIWFQNRRARERREREKQS